MLVASDAPKIRTAYQPRLGRLLGNGRRDRGAVTQVIDKVTRHAAVIVDPDAAGHAAQMRVAVVDPTVDDRDTNAAARACDADGGAAIAGHKSLIEQGPYHGATARIPERRALATSKCRQVCRE